MRFTSRRSSARAGQPVRRDRNGLVGLSGWLFADLLLGVAVIFLVGSEVPQKGLERRGASLGVTIETVDETVEKTADVWGVRDETFRLKITFTEEVRNFDVDDVLVSGDADQWVASFVDGSSNDGGGKDFVIELTPKSGLQDGDFTVEIPADAAFDADGSGNIAESQDFTLVTCFRYTGIDAKNEANVLLVGAADKGVAALISRLSENPDIAKAVAAKKKIGLMIIFGGGSQGSAIAGRNAASLIEALSDLGLVPSGKSASCDQTVPGGDLPTLNYKNDKMDIQDLDLRLYFLSQTGN